MNTYITAEIAAISGIHPNTVRLYEELQLISKPERESNGYRVFTDEDIKQLKSIRSPRCANYLPLTPGINVSYGHKRK